MGKIVNVYRVEYRIGEAEWTACIAAFSQDEATKHISKVIGKNIVVTSIGKETRIDAISESLRDTIINQSYNVEDDKEKVEQKQKIVMKKRTRRRKTEE
jgi:hypothetical protein